MPQAQARKQIQINVHLIQIARLKYVESLLKDVHLTEYARAIHANVRKYVKIQKSQEKLNVGMMWIAIQVEMLYFNVELHKIRHAHTQKHV